MKIKLLLTFCDHYQNQCLLISYNNYFKPMSDLEKNKIHCLVFYLTTYIL